MKPSQSLIERMCVRFRRLINERNRRLEDIIFVREPYSHATFCRMAQCAHWCFPEADFRWLMRLDDEFFLHDIEMCFRAISASTGKWMEPESEPRFVTRSRAEAAAAKKGGAK